jgi:hypothetical protein
MCKLLTLAFFTGFIGDALLQIITSRRVASGSQTKYDWGLKEYFKQHGRAEALFIASGMLTLFYILYVSVIDVDKTSFKANLLYLTIYGILLDLLFRKLNIFSSLKGYYKSLNYFWSAVWGIIPMLIPYVLYKYI